MAASFLLRLLVLAIALHAASALRIASLRSRTALLNVIAQKQSRAARKAVESAVTAVVADAANAKPALFSAPGESSFLSRLLAQVRGADGSAHPDDGVWRLLWSSQTADINPFAFPSEVLGGECVQRISARDGYVHNVVRWGEWELVGSARARAEMVGDVLRRSITITGVDIVQRGEQFATLFNMRALIDSEQAGDSGFLDDIYNDGLLRISRANNGFMYIYEREE